MSGHGGGSSYGGRDDRRGRRRSRSPRSDRHGSREDRGSYHDSRSRARQEHGLQGDHQGYREHNRDLSSTDMGTGTGMSTFSGLLELPLEVMVPSSGRALPKVNLPQHGKTGKLTRVLVNHFEIQSLPIVKTYTYNLQFNVPETSQRRGNSKPSAAQLNILMKLEAVQAFLKDDFVFDGVSLGWSTTAIVKVNEVKRESFDLPGSKPERPNQVEIILRNAGGLGIKSMVEYLTSGKIELDPSRNPAIEPLLKWLNAVYRHDPALRWTTRPNSSAFFDRTAGTYLPLRSTGHVLEAMRGIFQTVQIRFGRITLNVDTATTAFWAPAKNLIEIAHAFAGLPTSRNLQSWFLENSQIFFESCDRLLGIFFNVRHLPEQKSARKMRLRKWTQGDAAAMTFEFNNQGQNQRISVENYFKLKYNITLRYPKLPMADTKDGWFPLELCWSAPGERYKEPLQGVETADFIKFATAPASVRQQQIMESVRKLHWHTLKPPQSMGLSVKTKMLEVPARILPSPITQYRSGTDSRPSEMGSWNLRGKQFFEPSRIRSWGLMYFPAGHGVGSGALAEFTNAAQRAFSTLGLTVPKEPPAILKANSQADMIASVAQLMGMTKDRFGERPDLLMFLLHGPSERLYRGIKHLCDVQFGVASQVMVVDKAMSPRGQPQYLANIGLKINVKLGGINSTVSEPLFSKARWMLLGADTSHPSPAQLRMDPPPPTYAALSASWDRACCAYTAVATAQFSRQQTISDFDVMATELLERFRAKNNGHYPERILFYRDGLSESQYSAIMAEEVEPLKEACAALPGSRPKITAIVCVKRHHTRMFPTERGDKLGNVLPGTVVENSIQKDIYLVAHGGLQGTVQPTRYSVLLDENNLSDDDFQRLTNNICWSYARATRAVSLVPPVYYADQACERARQHIREGPGGKQILGQVHETLKYCMYWQ